MFDSSPMEIDCDAIVVRDLAGYRISEIRGAIATHKAMIRDALELEGVAGLDVEAVVNAVRYRADDYGPFEGDQYFVVTDATHVALVAAIVVADLEARSMPFELIAQHFHGTKISLADAVGLRRPVVMQHVRARAKHRAPKHDPKTPRTSQIGLVDAVAHLVRERDSF